MWGDRAARAGDCRTLGQRSDLLMETEETGAEMGSRIEARTRKMLAERGRKKSPLSRYEVGVPEQTISVDAEDEVYAYFLALQKIRVGHIVKQNGKVDETNV